MKRILLYILLVMSGAVSAQIITIPDINFKNKLLEADGSNNIAFDNSGNSIVVDTDGDNNIEVEDIRGLDLSGSAITSLVGIEYFSDLRELDCSNNSLAVLDISALSDLRELFCGGNALTALDASGLDQLRMLYCENNQISTLDLTGLDSLEELVCFSNQLTTLDFTGLEYLQHADCSDNQLAELDFSDCPELNELSCANNNLVHINIKNGELHSPATGANDWAGNPDLEFICVDEDEAATVNALLAFHGFTGVYVNTYCSFTPGGDYNTITGSLTFDVNGNGCDNADPPRSFIKVNIVGGPEPATTFSDIYGSYSFYTGAGNFTVTPQFENNFYNVTPASAPVNFPLVDNSTANVDFCIAPNGTHRDVEVVMVPVIPAQPGEDAVYKIVFKNKGNQTVAGAITCDWSYQHMEFVSMAPMADIIGLGTYTWFYSNLRPFENREITMTLNVNGPGDVPAVNDGDVLPFSADATVSGPLPDELPADNNFVFDQKVVGSYNPNNIICIQGDTEDPGMIGEYLHYAVNFENTGTEAATSVVIEQELDPAQFDINTVEMLNSSHPVTARIRGSMIEYIFQNINLAAADHGNILIKVKTKTSLMAGDAVSNTARIYYDYKPVPTNVVTTLFGLLGTNDYSNDLSVKVYPNPSKDILNITTVNTIQSVELYDLQGRLLQTNLVNDTTAVMDISARSAGMYFVKVITDKGLKVEKIMKQ